MNVKGKKKHMWDCEMHIRLTKTIMADIEAQIAKLDYPMSKTSWVYQAIVDKLKNEEKK